MQKVKTNVQQLSAQHYPSHHSHHYSRVLFSLLPLALFAPLHRNTTIELRVASIAISLAMSERVKQGPGSLSPSAREHSSQMSYSKQN